MTGSTADTYLEYVERNLPEGVSMKVCINILFDFFNPFNNFFLVIFATNIFALIIFATRNFLVIFATNFFFSRNNRN
jgi:hypothetical protein